MCFNFYDVIYDVFLFFMMCFIFYDVIYDVF